MRQHIQSQHDDDNLGNPAGGFTLGAGIEIHWQNGPLGRGEERKAPNGAFVEGVIAAARDRLQWYQSTKFACQSNALAIGHLTAALEILDARTRDREARAVEGTHVV